MIVPDSPESETLSIRTFGWPEIVLARTTPSNASAAGIEWTPIQFETRSVDALLIYLACQARSLGRDVLAELFWPERTQQQARANLRVAIHRLRQQLDPYLTITRQSVALNRDAPIELDAALFERDLASGQLEQATALYRGDFLDGFYLDGNPTFEQWVLLERERLRTLALAAWQQLIERNVADGHLNNAIAAARQLLQIDPLHEPTHRQLMRLLARLGNRHAALAQYEVCRGLLAAELDATPDETTTALAERIRVGELEQTTKWSRDRKIASTAEAITRSPSHLVTLSSPPLVNLPPQTTPFVGRNAELKQIAHLLANPDCRLLTLLGVGGIGKTRLALESATRQAGNFPDGVCFVGLAAVDEAELLTVAVAQALGVLDSSDDLLAQVAAYLRPRQLLLILDNFDHLLDAAETVAHLLDRAPRLKVLVTSRQRLALLEEWLLPIRGLDIEDDSQNEAGQLFIRSAQRVQPDFVIQGQEKAIAAICRQVEGMPLALELAASWVRVMPCSAIAKQIATDLDFLVTDVRNLSERHRSMRALFEQSWRLLAHEEKILLRRLSVFRGGWTLAEAISVAEATLPLLLSLADRSLIHHDGQSRFDVHELVRQYAAEQLEESREGDLIRQRHFNAYLQFMREADSQLRGASAASGYARIEIDLVNARAALRWALAAGRTVDAAWLTIALTHFWSVRAHWHEAIRWLEKLLPHRQLLPDRLRLATLLSLYHFWRSQEAFHPIEQYMDELIHLAQESDSSLMRAVVWRSVAVARADFDQAVAAWDRCLSLLDQAGNEPALDDAYCVYADLVHQQAYARFRYAIRLTDVGEYAQAERISSESLTLFRRRQNRDNILYPLGNLGRLALVRGDVMQARLLLQESIAFADEVGNRMGLGDWQPRLAIATFYCGDQEEAERLLHESLSLAHDLGNDMYLSRIYTYLAEIALWEEDRAGAAEWLTQAWNYHVNPRWPRTELVDCIWATARLKTLQQRYSRAATLFGLAETVGGRIHYLPAGPAKPLNEAALAAVRAALPNDEFAVAFAAGQQLSLDEAYATILAPHQMGHSHPG